MTGFRPPNDRNCSDYVEPLRRGEIPRAELAQSFRGSFSTRPTSCCLSRGAMPDNAGTHVGFSTQGQRSGAPLPRSPVCQPQPEAARNPNIPWNPSSPQPRSDAVSALASAPATPPTRHFDVYGGILSRSAPANERPTPRDPRILSEMSERDQRDRGTARAMQEHVQSISRSASGLTGGERRKQLRRLSYEMDPLQEEARELQNNKRMQANHYQNRVAELVRIHETVADNIPLMPEHQEGPNPEANDLRRKHIADSKVIGSLGSELAGAMPVRPPPTSKSENRLALGGGSHSACTPRRPRGPTAWGGYSQPSSLGRSSARCPGQGVIKGVRALRLRCTGVTLRCCSRRS